MAYCNGSVWIAMGSNSTVGFGTLTTNDFCIATSGTTISCSTVPTGTGNVVLSSSPTVTGTLAGVNSKWSGQIAVGTTTLNGALNVGGAINATTFTGAYTGNGSGLTGIGTASLGGITGTASSTTFLAGNGTWESLSGAGGAVGIGTTNYLPVWTGTSSLGNSAIYQSGSNIGIGTATPTATLHINKSAVATSTALISLTAADPTAGGNNVSSIGYGFDPSSGGYEALEFRNSDPGGGGGGYNFVNANGTTVGLHITPTGYVGIGTTNPSSALQVIGTAMATTFSGAHTGNGSGLTGIGTASLGGITGTASSTTYLRGDGTWATASGGVSGGTVNYVPLWTSATAIGTSMITQSGSYIGIGTATPANTLSVYGSGYISNSVNSSSALYSASTATTGGVGVAAAASSTTGTALQASASASSGVNYAVYATTNSSSGYDIYAGGSGSNYFANSVGIGVSSPSYPLSVSGIVQASTYLASANGTAGGPAYSLGNSGTGVFSPAASTLGFAANGSERMRISPAGSVEIGASAYAAGNANIELNVAGYIQTSRSTTSTAGQIQFGNPNGIVGTITTNGSATAYNTSSDRRLKENITPSTRGLDDLAKIQVEDFNFAADPKKVRVQGFIAQALRDIYPEAVTTNGDDGVEPLEHGKASWSVDYGRLTPLLVKSIQELKAANDNLVAAHQTDAARIQRLEDRFATLQATKGKQ